MLSLVVGVVPTIYPVSDDGNNCTPCNYCNNCNPQHRNPQPATRGVGASPTPTMLSLVIGVVPTIYPVSDDGNNCTPCNYCNNCNGVTRNIATRNPQPATRGVGASPTPTMLSLVVGIVTTVYPVSDDGNNCTPCNYCNNCNGVTRNIATRNTTTSQPATRNAWGRGKPHPYHAIVGCWDCDDGLSCFRRRQQLHPLQLLQQL
jgi:hypothetical protein